MTWGQYAMVVGQSTNDPKFEGMNPTAGVTRRKLQKEKKVLQFQRKTVFFVDSVHVHRCRKKVVMTTKGP